MFVHKTSNTAAAAAKRLISHLDTCQLNKDAVGSHNRPEAASDNMITIFL